MVHDCDFLPTLAFGMSLEIFDNPNGKSNISIIKDNEGIPLPTLTSEVFLSDNSDPNGLNLLLST